MVKFFCFLFIFVALVLALGSRPVFIEALSNVPSQIVGTAMFLSAIIKSSLVYLDIEQIIPYEQQQQQGCMIGN